MIILYTVTLNGNLITEFYIADNIVRNFFIKLHICSVIKNIYFKLSVHYTVILRDNLSN